MKAEPDSRVVKGKDVKFSVDDFEKAGTTAWEGVRSYEARNIMRDKMKVGDKVLFYHSNCKMPGVAALAEVAKEAYPDHTAWDPSHPYYDAKSDKDNARWFMVDVRFVRRLEHFVPLAVLKGVGNGSGAVEYLREDHVGAIKGMALINKGRLSVQPVSGLAYEAIVMMGDKGGYETAATGTRSKKRKVEEDGEEEEAEPGPVAKKGKRGR
ncbi:DUF55-domain-containing protein [Auricularia subglabra TFB-10046 SS5]|uniref:DUF55-domain-containing protein n=1 Tax=Auricularia subglabra (strain TFB-10046 / SS5) TaxID=717982 RepID=J0CZ95_AURST|nr:DUF55-domain-containing protein [Auricularia subglabra TFB-10046 SS5]